MFGSPCRRATIAGVAWPVPILRATHCAPLCFTVATVAAKSAWLNDTVTTLTVVPPVDLIPFVNDVTPAIIAAPGAVITAARL